jgi:hypothetical protein
MKDSSRLAGDAGDIHRNVLILFDMADRDVGTEHCLLKRETATQKKADKVRLPKTSNVFDLPIKFPFSVNVVTGDICPNVCTGA